MHAHTCRGARARGSRGAPFANTFRAAPRDTTALSLPSCRVPPSFLGQPLSAGGREPSATNATSYPGRRRGQAVISETIRLDTPLLRFSVDTASKTRALRTCACANRGGVAATDDVSLRTTQAPPPCPAYGSRLDGATYKASRTTVATSPHLAARGPLKTSRSRQPSPSSHFFQITESVTIRTLPYAMPRLLNKYSRMSLDLPIVN